MRRPAAFIVALAGGVACAIVLSALSGLNNFESATTVGVARKVGDLLLVSGLSFLLMLPLAGILAVGPFVITCRLLQSLCPTPLAAMLGSLLGTTVALLPFAILRRWATQDAISLATSYEQLLPGALVCGLVGGLVFTRVSSRPEP